MIYFVTVLMLLFNSALQMVDPNDLKDGDDRFAAMDYAAAAAKYDAALQASPNSAEALWRLSRVYVCMGEVAAADDAEALHRKGEKYARLAVLADEKNPSAHTWLAAALGNLTNFTSDNKAKILMSRDVVSECLRAIELNPKDDVAYSILGSFYRAMGNIGWLEKRLAATFIESLPDGSYAESETMLKKAIALAPRAVRHRYELGLLYLDMNRKADAKKVFADMQSLQPQLRSDRDRLAKIKDLLPTLN